MYIIVWGTYKRTSKHLRFTDNENDAGWFAIVAYQKKIIPQDGKEK